MKKLLLIAWVFLAIGCVPLAPVTEFEDVQEIKLKGITSMGNQIISNTIHDTMIDAVMYAIATGTHAFGNWRYIWIKHKEYISDSSTYWEQLTNTQAYAGGADTCAYYELTAGYTAEIGGVYDSILEERGTFPGAFIDSPSVYFTVQYDTTVLESGDFITFYWELEATKTGTNILDTLLWHVVDFLDNGTCDDIDSCDLIYNNDDTSRVECSFSFDYVNDSLYIVCQDTQRSTADDTLKQARLFDDDGVCVYQKAINGGVTNPSTPKLTVKLAFTK